MPADAAGVPWDLRVQARPFGWPADGVKDRGPGRDGPRRTIEEMTGPTLLVINRQLS